MKPILFALSMISFAISTSPAKAAAPDCSGIVANAGYKAFTKKEEAVFEQVISMTTTSTGKDKYYLEFVMNEECDVGVVVYTETGTCNVVAQPVQVGTPDCG